MLFVEAMRHAKKRRHALFAWFLILLSLLAAIFEGIGIWFEYQSQQGERSQAVIEEGV